MEEYPDCIDSLIFKDKKGLDISCETGDTKFNYSIFNDTLYLERWDDLNYIDTTTGIIAKEWYILTSQGLTWAKVKRRRGDFWDDLDSEYLHRFYFKKVN